MALARPPRLSPGATLGAWPGMKSNGDAARRKSPATRITIIVIVLLLLIGARSIASYAIEVKWWKELGQFNTWLSMLYYGIAPVAGRHPAGVRRALDGACARSEVRRHGPAANIAIYARISTLALLLLA